MRNTIQATICKQWTGCDQPLTLDRRGGTVFVLLLDAVPGRRSLEILAQNAICKTGRGMAGHGLLPSWPGDSGGGTHGPASPGAPVTSQLRKTALGGVWPPG